MAKLHEDVFRILRTRNTKEIDKVSTAATAHKEIRAELLNGLTSTDDFYRYNCFRTMLQVTEEDPLLVYSSWDRLEQMLSSENSYHQNIAVCLLANLTSVDKSRKFERISDDYFDLLDSEGMILARYVAQNAGKIARSKPALQAKVTKRLLAVEFSRQKQKELIKTDVINSFSEYFSESNDKEKILTFVTKQVKSSSPKTRKAAKAFLKKWAVPEKA
jgi:hypothetical protein